MPTPAETEIIEQINWLKKVFTNQCLFCGNEIETISRKEGGIFLPLLPICEFCLSKLDLHKTFLAQAQHYGKDHKLIKLVKDWFANRCYFCESDIRDIKFDEKDILFPICNVSCLQRYRIIIGWEKKKGSWF